MQPQILFIRGGGFVADPGAGGNGYSEATIVLEFCGLVAEAWRSAG